VMTTAFVETTAAQRLNDSPRADENLSFLKQA
jgi:hypothetical protein